jgi:hypothetical protein
MRIKAIFIISFCISIFSSQLSASGFIQKALMGPIAGSCGYALGGIIGDGLDARFQEVSTLEKANIALGNSSFDIYRKNIERLVSERKARPVSALEAFFYLRKDSPHIQHFAYGSSLLAAASCNTVGLAAWSLALVALNVHKIVDTEEYIAYLSKTIEDSKKNS